MYSALYICADKTDYIFFVLGLVVVHKNPGIPRASGVKISDSKPQGLKLSVGLASLVTTMKWFVVLH